MQVIADDLKQLGYIFQWSKLNAAYFLLLQRRLRVWGFADLDEGQDLDDFSSRMHDTLHSMASEIRFPFEAVFDATIPEAPVDGNAALNVQQALESSAIKNGSSNLFVDTSTSSQWASEYAENISTYVSTDALQQRKCFCVRASLPRTLTILMQSNVYCKTQRMHRVWQGTHSHRQLHRFSCWPG